MNEKIKEHVDALFQGAPDTKHISDIKEELIANLSDKYNDLLAEGKSELEAAQIVFAGIGNVRDLFYDEKETHADRKNAALVNAFGISVLTLGIFAAILAMLFLKSFFYAMFSVSAIAIAVGLIVYAHTSVTVHVRKDETFTETYMEKRSMSERDKKIRHATDSTIWLFIVIAYLLISFYSGWWHVTWIIFLLGGALTTLLSIPLTEPGKRIGKLRAVMWQSVTAAYFVISFWTGAWHITWVIFLAAAALGQSIKLIELWRADE